MPKTSFDAKFADKDKPVTLYCIISPDSPKQQGENFLEFVRLVNEQPMGDIAKVIIVDTSYLLRHYDFRYSDSNNQKLLFEWREANKQSIRQIQIPYEVISWLELVKRDGYQAFHEKIKKSFDDGTDEEFRKIICAIASQFTHKGTTKQSISYLLEECTATALLEGYETYPGKLNDAIQYIRRQYGIGPIFVPYTLGRLPTQPKPKEKDKEITSSGRASPAEKSSPRSSISRGNSTFFSADGSTTTSTSLELSKMSFSDNNHVWSAKFDLEFLEESKDEAIKTLLFNLGIAKQDYERKREKLPHPQTLTYNQRCTGYMLSYEIEIKNSSVLVDTIDPFALLIGAIELKSGKKGSLSPSSSPREGQPKQLESQHEQQSSQQKSI